MLQRIVPIVPSLMAACIAASACETAEAGAHAEVANVRGSAPEEEELAPTAGSADEAKAEPVAATPPPTELSLTLLATLVGDDGRATIRDDDAGTIASYRVGELIRPEVEIAAITEEGVELRSQAEVSWLGFSEEAAQLSADDVFYPDLAHYDDLPNAMADAVQLQDGPGYMVKTQRFAWGTPRSVAAVKEALRAYARAHPDAPMVYVGDLSKEGGGPFPPHVSHQSGRDVDIGFAHVGANAGARRFVRATAGNLDMERTWALLEALIGTGQVAYVFLDYRVQGLLFEWASGRGINPARLEEWFQYPRGKGAAHGLVRHWKGHDDHLHVRFRQ